MSDKVKVFEIAEEAGSTSAEVMQKAKELGIELKTAQAAVSFEDAEEIMQYILTGKSSKIKEPIEKPKKIEVKKEESKEEKIEPIKQETTIKKATKKDLDIPIDDKEVEVSAVKVVPKRKGLVIIKKKRDTEIDNKTPEKESVVQKKSQKSLSEIFSDDSGNKNFENQNSKKADIASSKVKKEKKKTPIKAQEHGKKIEVISDDKEFKSSDDSLLGEEVVLFDMDLSDTYKIFDEPKPVNSANHSRSSKPAAFGNAPTGLKRGKRKKEL